jgi:hypothetical protein
MMCSSFVLWKLVLRERIELSTSPLPIKISVEKALLNKRIFNILSIRL